MACQRLGICGPGDWGDASGQEHRWRGDHCLPQSPNLRSSDWPRSLHWAGGQGGASQGRGGHVLGFLALGGQHLREPGPPCPLGPGLLGGPCEVSSAPQEVLKVQMEDSTTTREALCPWREFPRADLPASMSHRLGGPGCLPGYSRQGDAQARARCSAKSTAPPEPQLPHLQNGGSPAFLATPGGCWDHTCS